MLPLYLLTNVSLQYNNLEMGFIRKQAWKIIHNFKAVGHFLRFLVKLYIRSRDWRWCQLYPGARQYQAEDEGDSLEQQLATVWRHEQIRSSATPPPYCQ